MSTTKNELMAIQKLPFAEVMSMSEAFAASGMFPDVSKAGQAMVKIIAGQEIGIPPFQAMNGIHIIKGKTTLGAGIIASRVKGSGKYDYKVLKLDDTECSIDFYQGKDNIGNSKFTIAEAKKAGTQNLERFPKNMLFARAMSNGVKWYCPDVFAGPVYVPEEMAFDNSPQTEDAEHEEVKVLPAMGIGSKAFKSAVKAMQDGKTIEQVRGVAEAAGMSIPEDVELALNQALEEAA